LLFFAGRSPAIAEPWR